MVEYGHATLRAESRTYHFIPSFRNIDKIGSPKEIITIYLTLAQGIFDIYSFNLAIKVIDACQETNEDIDLIFGSTTMGRDGKRKIKLGLDKPQKAYILALHLLKHGIAGPARGDGEKGEEITEFHAVKYMNMARSYLNMSAEEAGNLTMTEFVMLADFKRDSEREEPTMQEHRDTMSWLEEVNSRRAAKHNH